MIRTPINTPPRLQGRDSAPRGRDRAALQESNATNEAHEEARTRAGRSIAMQSAREMLEEMARNKEGLVTLREVMGAAGKVHRHRARIMDELVMNDLAVWVNPHQTIARITSAGLQSLKDWPTE